MKLMFSFINIIMSNPVNSKALSLFKKAIIVGGGIYTAACALLYFMQNKFIYLPISIIRY